MAEELKVTAVYLSSVENGKRNIPKHWGSEITRIYELDEEQSQLLLEAIEESKTILKIDFETLRVIFSNRGIRRNEVT